MHKQMLSLVLATLALSGVAYCQDPVDDAIQARFGQMARRELRVRLVVLHGYQLQFDVQGWKVLRGRIVRKAHPLPTRGAMLSHSTVLGWQFLCSSGKFSVISSKSVVCPTFH